MSHQPINSVVFILETAPIHHSDHLHVYRFGFQPLHQ